MAAVGSQKRKPRVKASLAVILAAGAIACGEVAPVAPHLVERSRLAMGSLLKVST